MFRGISSINLDDKGRLAIPTRYREELQDCCERQMIVTVAVDERCIGENGCLWLYPLPEWEKLEQTISKLPTLNKMAGKLRRFVIGNASECEMDAQGRLLLPEKLRKFATMDKKIVLELHHKNGHSKDNRLENIVFLCPNCHSQTTTHRGRNYGNADGR